MNSECFLMWSKMWIKMSKRCSFWVSFMVKCLLFAWKTKGKSWKSNQNQWKCVKSSGFWDFFLCGPHFFWKPHKRRVSRSRRVSQQEISTLGPGSGSHHSKSGNSRPSGVKNVREYQIKFANIKFSMCSLNAWREASAPGARPDTRVQKSQQRKYFS